MYEVRVFGDWQFIFDAFNAIARMSESGVLNYIAAAAFTLTFGWGFVKQMVDDKPNMYFKEMFLGIMMWIFLASPQGVKIDVAILSVNDPSVFAVVNNVPFLAAFPAWLATNALSSVREELQRQFIPVSYASGQGTSDPLNALLKMYNTPLPAEINLGNVQTSGGYDLAKSISNYVRECFIAMHELDGAEPSSPITVMRKSTLDLDFWNTLRVDFNGIGTDVFLNPGGSEFGEFLDCPQAHREIFDELRAPALQAGIESFNENRGITSAAIADGMAAIQGSYGTGPNSYEIQVGLFTAYMVRDGLRNTAFETQVDQMIFQAQRSRVFDKAGEASLFNSISIPVVTALESFSLFIYPIYVILMVVGAAGIKHVGKYFMLIVFVNLWGIMKVFVDFYTISVTEQAFAVVDNPFTFDGMPNTIVELEGFLATAASLNTAIPMFAMFLLFGGVHSMMGAMGKMTQGNVDSKYSAPNISSSMNNGAMDMGDYSGRQSSQTGNMVSSYQNIQSASLGSASVSGQFNDAIGAQSSVSQARSAQASNSFDSAYNTAMTATTNASTGQQFTAQESGAYSEGMKATESLAKNIENSTSLNASESREAAYGLTAGGGLMVGGTGIKGDMAEKLRLQYGDQYSAIEKAANQTSNSISTDKQYANLNQATKTEGNSLGSVLQSGNSEAYSASLKAVDARSEATSVAEDVKSASAVGRNMDLALADAATLGFNSSDLYKQLTEVNEEGSAINSLVKEGYSEQEAQTLVKQQLSDIGVNNADDIEQIAIDKSGSNNFDGTGVGGLMAINDRLSKLSEGEGGENQGVDTVIMGAGYNYVGDELNATSPDTGNFAGNAFKSAGSELTSFGKDFISRNQELDKNQNFIADADGQVKTRDEIKAAGQNAMDVQNAVMDGNRIGEDVKTEIDDTYNGITQDAFEHAGIGTSNMMDNMRAELDSQVAETDRHRNASAFMDKGMMQFASTMVNASNPLDKFGTNLGNGIFNATSAAGKVFDGAGAAIGGAVFNATESINGLYDEFKEKTSFLTQSDSNGPRSVSYAKDYAGSPASSNMYGGNSGGNVIGSGSNGNGAGVSIDPKQKAENELTNYSQQNDGNGFESGNSVSTAQKIETNSGGSYSRVGHTVGDDGQKSGTLYRDFSGDMFRYDGFGMKSYDGLNTDVRLFPKK
ncbi:MAG: hypothetical protein ACI9T7_000031 [Oleiphilaceae bacterium]|jgi:hypothetical protein